MANQINTTARGKIRPATPQEIERENRWRFLASDSGFILATDSGIPIALNLPEFGYTNPDLHRRIDNDPEYIPGVHYPFVKYDENGIPYKQDVVIGVWDGVNSYRTTTSYVHDEESTTCEIP